MLFDIMSRFILFILSVSVIENIVSSNEETEENTYMTHVLRFFTSSAVLQPCLYCLILRLTADISRFETGTLLCGVNLPFELNLNATNVLDRLDILSSSCHREQILPASWKMY